jgi:hypothetical protein
MREVVLSSKRDKPARQDAEHRAARVLDHARLTVRSL